MSTALRRSFLFVPGVNEKLLAKAFASGADGAILDLEDAVAVSEKPRARTIVLEALKTYAASPGSSCASFVRVNATETPWCFRDLMTVVGPWLVKHGGGIMLPKTDTPSQLQTVDWIIGQLEEEHGMEKGSVEVMPLIETAKAMANLQAIAQAAKALESGRVRCLSFGAGDFTIDMGISWGSGADLETSGGGSAQDANVAQELLLQPSRGALVLQSRAAGLEAPIDCVFTRVGAAKDAALMQALQLSTTTPRQMGFAGKLCIHPEQVAVANTVFTPSEKEVERAMVMLEAFEKAEAEGKASILVGGDFVDYPIAVKARRTIKAAEQA